MFILTDYSGPSNASPAKSLSSSSSSSATSSDSESSVTAGSFSSVTVSSSTTISDVAEETSCAKPLSSKESAITSESFKLVGDNIDKHVKPREMREDAQSQSLHYFNCYAVKSRLPDVNKSETASLPDYNTFQETKILPSDEDTTAIRENFEVLIGRVLKKHCSFFSKFATGVPRHIKHENYKEMCKKSEIVSH